MKTVLLVCLAAMALARPDRDAQTIRDNRAGPEEDGSYNFDFETDNGVSHNEVGSPGPEGAIVSQGSYRYTDGDGNTFEVRYIANENGFQAEGDHLPVAPPAPAHVAELLRIAEDQRAAGVTFERK